MREIWNMWKTYGKYIGQILENSLEHWENVGNIWKHMEKQQKHIGTDFRNIGKLPGKVRKTIANIQENTPLKPWENTWEEFMGTNFLETHMGFHQETLEKCQDFLKERRFA